MTCCCSFRDLWKAMGNWVICENLVGRNRLEEEEDITVSSEIPQVENTTQVPVPSTRGNSRSDPQTQPDQNHIGIPIDTELYRLMKRLASFVNRKQINGETVEELAGKLSARLKIERETSDLKQCVFATLATISRDNSVAYPTNGDSKLLECLHKYFMLVLGDGSERHKCENEWCNEMCVLPTYAHNCLDTGTIDEILDRVENILTYRGDLISMVVDGDAVNECKTAENVLKYIASFGDPTLKDGYDVLYAMAGHRGKIFCPTAKVDSRLYEKLYGLFRSSDDRSPNSIGMGQTIRLLSIRNSHGLKEIVNRIENGGTTNRDHENIDLDLENADLGFDLDTSGPDLDLIRNIDAPPSYDTLQHDTSLRPSAPPGNTSPNDTSQEGHLDDELPTYEQVLDGMVNQGLC